jgi:GT2 family glycosyltransferase
MPKPVIALLIISNSKNEYLLGLLENTILSAINNCCTHSLNLCIYCSEKSDEIRDLLSKRSFKTIVKFYPQREPFNYNGELNYLASIAKTDSSPDYFIFANSDLYFHNDCIPEMIRLMEQNGVHSASPYDPWVHGLEHLINPNSKLLEGYLIRYHVAGWCIFTSSKAYQTIEKLDEDVAFWYSDNIYADQLKKAMIPHVLITSAICEHIGSKTLNSSENQDKEKLTYGERTNYINARRKLFSTTQNTFFEESPLPSLDSVIDKHTRIIELLGCNELKKWHTELELLFVKEFVHQPLSIVSTLFLMKSSFRILEKEKSHHIWNKIKNGLPIQKKSLARSIRLNLLFR